jgi:lipopolysaccharide/colanic/teichoic acid biosynthesis glycosyltransferase
MFQGLLGPSKKKSPGSEGRETVFKRTVDVIISSAALLVMSPALSILVILVFLQDFYSPLYFGLRVGRYGNRFKIIKLRTMLVDSDKLGCSSTATTDKRITPLGRTIRRLKLDEFFQLLNVLKGEMSLVGPRPQVPEDVAIYTEEERALLTVLPGITDISSLVFIDEGDILRGRANPSIAYQQLIRPWKSRLGILYRKNQSVPLDIELMALTLLALFSREFVLNRVQNILLKLGADEIVCRVAKRHDELVPYPPPGASDIVAL